MPRGKVDSKIFERRHVQADRCVEGEDERADAGANHFADLKAARHEDFEHADVRHAAHPASA